MPWTGDTTVLDNSFGNRPSLVSTHAIHGIQPAIVAKNGNDPSFDHHLPGLPIHEWVRHIDADPFQRAVVLVILRAVIIQGSLSTSCYLFVVRSLQFTQQV